MCILVCGRTYPSRFHVEMGSYQTDSNKQDVSCTQMRRTQTQVEADPACDQTSVEMAVRNDDHIARALTLLFPEAVVFPNLYAVSDDIPTMLTQLIPC